MRNLRLIIKAFTEYINKNLGPVLVLQLTIGMTVVSGLVGCWMLWHGPHLVGLAVALLSLAASVIECFLLLFLTQDEEDL